MSDINEDEIIIDFSKIWRIICYRKLLILTVFILIIASTVVITFILPKKYETSAKILINKSAATNITELNPFVRSEMASSDKTGITAALMGSNTGLNDEIEILKSPLVLNPVIKANNLTYQRGHHKGELLSVEDFLKKNIDIENIKNSSVIQINYKNKSPETAYKVVKDIIDNYKTVYEQLNVNKAARDTKLLEKEYITAKAALDKKINQLKNVQNGTRAEMLLNSGNFNILNYFDKRINSSMRKNSNSLVDTRKLQVEIDQLSDKLKLLDMQYEQSRLIGKLSENAAKMIILQQPELKKNFDYKEPKLKITLLLGTILSVIISFLVLIIVENNDKKLTYSVLGENVLINPVKLELESKLSVVDTGNIAVIDLVNSAKSQDLINQIKNDILLPVTATFTTDSVKKHLENIKNAEKIILLGKIGKTEKIFYKSIKNLNPKSDIECIEITLY